MLLGAKLLFSCTKTVDSHLIEVCGNVALCDPEASGTLSKKGLGHISIISQHVPVTFTTFVLPEDFDFCHFNRMGLLLGKLVRETTEIS